MHTFRHYRLQVHLRRKAGHDTYLACPIDEPEHRVVLKIFDAECIVPKATPDNFRQLETQLRDLKHPHIAAVLELGIEQGKPYIVSEYQGGGSLLQYLERRASGLLSLEEAVGVVMQVGQATAFAHTHGMLHQDIRLENILLNEQGKALLADFRLSSLIQESGRSYLAPEQMTEAASTASDQYALGCLLYELITGVAPDPPVLRQHATLTPLVASKTLPLLPRRIEAIILRTLAIKPRERYPDVKTFVATLNVAVHPGAQISAFEQLIQGYQPTVSGDLTEEEFPLLLPNAPLMPQNPPQQEEGTLPALPAATSLEAFLMTTEWDGISLLDRLALVDGQEDVLILPGASEMSPSSEKHLLAPALQGQKDPAAPSAPEEGKKAAVTAQAKMPVKGGSIDTNLQANSQGAKENPQSSTNSLFTKEQPKLAIRAKPDRRRPVLLLGIALMLTLATIAALLVFALGGGNALGSSVTRSSVTRSSTSSMAFGTIAQTDTPYPTQHSTSATPGKMVPTPTITAASGTKSPVSHSVSKATPTNSVPTATPTLSGTGSVQIDAGGSGAGSFVADEDFTDITAGRLSSTTTTTAVIDTSGVSNPAPESVYQSARIGDCLYTIPNLTPQASYTVRLHFAELYWTEAGDRTFNVLINNQQVLSNFDIFAAAGAEDKAVVKAFVVPASSSGTITIEFMTVKNNALINAIEVVAV